MAGIYPTPIGPTQSSAERLMYDVLRAQLVVFHDVPWLSRPADRAPMDGEADFVIAYPNLGVLVIDVR